MVFGLDNNHIIFPLSFYISSVLYCCTRLFFLQFIFPFVKKLFLFSFLQWTCSKVPWFNLVFTEKLKWIILHHDPFLVVSTRVVFFSIKIYFDSKSSFDQISLISLHYWLSPLSHQKKKLKTEFRLHLVRDIYDCGRNLIFASKCIIRCWGKAFSDGSITNRKTHALI